MNILLVKLSSLGDVVHTLPVVQDILAAFPAAQIDWVVEKSFSPVLCGVRGLHRVIPCELRRWRKTFWTLQTRAQWLTFKADLQRDPYDAVIDLQGLTKSAVVARLARLSSGGQRFAMANRTEGSGYEVPTRWLADVALAMTPHVHAVARGRALAAQALGYAPAAKPDFGLIFKPNQPLVEASIACVAIENIASEAVAVAVAVADADADADADVVPDTVALVHGTSRADKQWPLAHWVALGKRLNAAGCQVALVHGNAQEQATSQAMAALLDDAVVWPLLPLDAVTRALARCSSVVGVDSGVSHLAVALDLPHVQLYNVDTAWRTGPDPVSSQGRQISVFAQPTPSVAAVWRAWQAVINTGPARQG